MPAPFSFVPAAVDDSGTMDYSQFIRPGVVPWGSWGQQAMDWLRGANARAQASTRSPELQASTADAFRGAAALSGSGYSDIGQGDIIGGAPKVLMGSAAGFLSPVTGATETLVEKPLTQLTGNPDFGSKAGFLAGLPELNEPAKLAMALGPGVKAASEAAKIAGEGTNTGNLIDFLSGVRNSPIDSIFHPGIEPVFNSAIEELAKAPSEKTIETVKFLTGSNYKTRAEALRGLQKRYDEDMLDYNRRAAVQKSGLERDVTTRGRSGRPLQSAGFNPAADQQILNAGYQRAAPPAAKIAREGGSGTIGGMTVRQRILDAIKTDPFAEWGLRVTEDPLTPGEPAPPSRRWENGEPTDEILPGTSVVHIPTHDEAGLEKAIKRAGIGQGYGKGSFYFGKHVSLIKGKSLGQGEDQGEVLLRNSHVQNIFEKTDDGPDPFNEEAPQISPPSDGLTPSEKGGSTRAESPKGDTTQQPLLRQVLARGRSGRPLQSAGFNPEADQAILEAGYQRATAPPAAKIAGEDGAPAARNRKPFGSFAPQ